MIEAYLAYESKNKAQVGLFHAFVASIGIFLQQLIVKVFKGTFGPGQMTFLRFFYLLLLNVGAAHLKKVDVYPPKKKFTIVTIRNFSGGICTPILYYTLSRLPLSLCTIFGQMVPLVVPFLDWLIYKAKYTMKEVCISVVAVTGVMMVSSAKQDIPMPDQAVGMEKLVLIFWMFFVYSGSYALSSVLVKDMTELSTFTINTQFAFFGLVFGAGLELTESNLNGSFQDFILVGGLIGIIGSISQFSFIKAYQLAKPGRVTIINSTHVVIAFLIEFLIYGTTPNVYQVLGTIMTVGSVIFTLVLKQNI